MTFPIDFHRHPKLVRLPIEVRWAFVEMNAEARMADNDGIFLAEDAEFLWSAEVLEALLKSHPARPLLERDGEGRYVIREYAKHQQTREDRESLSAKRTAAANARWGNRGKQANASALQEQSASMHPPAQSESQSQSQSQDLLLTESVSLGSNARENSTGLTQEEITKANHTASGLGVNLERVIGSAAKLGRPLNHREALMLAVIIIDKAKTEPKRPDAYIGTVMKESAFEVQKWIDTEVLA